MAKFTVEHKTAKSPQDAYQTIKTFLSGDNDFQRIDSSVRCEPNDEKMKLNIIGSQFKADVSVQASGSGAQIAIQVDLPFLLMPFKSKITESLQRKLTKHLG